jgi:hypothetical protein
MMQKRQFEQIAAILRKANLSHDDSTEELENNFADFLSGENPRFDRSRFLAACRGEDATDSAGRRVSYGR